MHSETGPWCRIPEFCLLHTSKRLRSALFHGRISSLIGGTLPDMKEANQIGKTMSQRMPLSYNDEVLTCQVSYTGSVSSLAGEARLCCLVLVATAAYSAALPAHSHPLGTRDVPVLPTLSIVTSKSKHRCSHQHQDLKPYVKVQLRMLLIFQPILYTKTSASKFTCFILIACYRI